MSRRLVCAGALLAALALGAARPAIAKESLASRIVAEAEKEYAAYASADGAKLAAEIEHYYLDGVRTYVTKTGKRHRYTKKDWKRNAHVLTHEWCAMFVSTVVRAAAADQGDTVAGLGLTPSLEHGKSMGVSTSAPALARAFQSGKDGLRFIPAGQGKPEPGDIVFTREHRKTGIAHVAIVVSVKGNTVWVIEGNYGGKFRHGKLTKARHVVGYGRFPSK